MNRMSRKEAKADGLKKYWPLKVCSQGHDAMRRVSGACVVCENVAHIKWKAEYPEIAARSSASAWAKANPERHRANSSRWQKANMWHAVLATNNRRALKKRADGYATKADIELIFEQHNHSCAHCGAKHALEIDHIIPLAKGGSNWPNNLQILCRSCNARKGSRMPDMSKECLAA